MTTPQGPSDLADRIEQLPYPYALDDAGSHLWSQALKAAAALAREACAELRAENERLKKELADRMEREGAEQKQAVDADWFKSLCRGFTHWGHDAIRLSDGTLILEPNGSEYDLCFAHRSDTWTLLKSPTRGDVLRLLSALGINITQEAKQ
jgi:hypothetical protein